MQEKPTTSTTREYEPPVVVFGEYAPPLFEPDPDADPEARGDVHCADDFA